MTEPAVSRISPVAVRRVTRVLTALPLALGVSLAAVTLGAATSYGQLLLPAQLSPLANSASPWVAFCVAAVWLTGAPWTRSAALGALALVLVNCGYAIVSTLRGFPYNPLDWNLIGLLVGPVLGLAAWGIHSRRVPLVALGSGVVAALVVGECAYGLVTLNYPEQRAYWISAGVLVLGWLSWLAVRRVRATLWVGVQALLVALAGIGFAAVLGGH